MLIEQRYLCPICQQPIMLGARVHLDHRVPVSKGGRHILSNLQATHPRCNLRKNARV